MHARTRVPEVRSIAMHALTRVPEVRSLARSRTPTRTDPYTLSPYPPSCHHRIEIERIGFHPLLKLHIVHEPQMPRVLVRFVHGVVRVCCDRFGIVL